MEAPSWFVEELALRWPRLRVVWFRYRRKELVIPVTGDAWFRVTGKDGVVEYLPLEREPEERSFLTPPWDPTKETVELEDEFGAKWKVNPSKVAEAKPIRPDARDLTDGRFVIQQSLAGSSKYEKVFDCVDDKGRLHPLDRRLIAALHRRCDAWDRAEDEVEQNEEAQAAEHEAKVEDGFVEAFDALASSSLPQFGFDGTPVPKGEWKGGYYVLDRRSHGRPAES